MADKQYEWLNQELAERLLRGESLDNAVEPTARDEAERLAKTLGALSVDPPPSTTELPGEEAALAAFRKAHADRGTGTARTEPGATAATHADVGLVRIAGRGHGPAAPPGPRPRRGRRPVRLALAAALAFGMAGGVAAAAGAGLLPTPFGDGEPGPNASVSAAVTSDRPLVSPSPDGTGEAEPTPDGSSAGAADEGAGRDTARDGASSSPGTGKDGKPSSWWSAAPSACRDLRDGKELSTDRRRALEGLAGGSTRVWKFCQGVLDSSSGTRADTRSDAQPGEDGDGGKGKGDDRDDNGNGGGQGNGKGDDDGHHRGSGGGDHGGGNRHDPDGGSSTPEPDTTAPLLPKKAAASPQPAPSPSYSTL
ncbi:hypothetical protein [Streptomyces justiciae]|uniref:hypothetical protein n=1 Tax=Streptomyces justiciae TaxID=2780140 RepID=UPI0021194B05|nr:hypothetical protein [Streptomyces justiciae]MCW8377844.1 hypothetical protein [Streptomyces justiciae]